MPNDDDDRSDSSFCVSRVEHVDDERESAVSFLAIS